MSEVQQIKTVIAALVKARDLFKPVEKSGKNNHTNKAYPKLEDLIAATKDGLKSQGLFYRFEHGWSSECDCPVLTGILTHAESGEEIRSWMLMPEFTKNQDVGATQTYFRRYIYQAHLNLSGDDDDDGQADARARQNAGTKNISHSEQAKKDFQQIKQEQKPQKPINHAPNASGLSAADISRLLEAMKRNSWRKDNVREFCEAFHKKDSPDKLNREEFKVIYGVVSDMDYLTAKATYADIFKEPPIGIDPHEEIPF